MVRMMNLLPTPSLHLLEAGTCVFIPAPVVPETPSGGVRHPGKLRYIVSQRAEPFLALSQRIGREFTVSNVRGDPEHVCGAALLVEERSLHGLQPANSAGGIRDDLFSNEEILERIEHIPVLLLKARHFFLILVEISIRLA